MSNQELTVFQDKSAPTELAPEFHAMVEAGIAMDDLGAGIGGNYAIISTRGSKFRIKQGGTETVITDPNTGDPVGSLEAVIVRANPYLTKQFFEGGYVEGSTEAPSCFSIDGKVPAASVENPQHTNCAMCPQNRFGSRVTDAGVKVKACQDNKKLAVSPLADLENKAFGGPMLFRVPASALKDLVAFNNLMTARGYPYNAVAVRIGFDVDASYPKPTFRAIRVLTSEEAKIVMEQYQSDAVERLLGDFSEIHAGAIEAAPAADEAFEQPPSEQPQPKPVVQPKPPIAKPAPAAAKPAATKAAPAAAKPAPAAAKPAAPAQPKAAPTKAAVAPPGPPLARPKAAAAAKPAPALQPEPVAEEAAPEAAEEVLADQSGMEQSIEDILSELNAVTE